MLVTHTAMEVRLDPEMERWIQQEVRLDRYPTVGEVVRDALWRLREESVPEEEARAAFRADLDQRLASLDRGEWVDPAEVFR